MFHSINPLADCRATQRVLSSLERLTSQTRGWRHTRCVMQERMDFLRSDLVHLFDGTGIDKSAYEEKVDFQVHTQLTLQILSPTVGFCDIAADPLTMMARCLQDPITNYNTLTGAAALLATLRRVDCLRRSCCKKLKPYRQLVHMLTLARGHVQATFSISNSCASSLARTSFSTTSAGLATGRSPADGPWR